MTGLPGGGYAARMPLGGALSTTLVGVALGVTPVPGPLSPTDGGWLARDGDLRAYVLPSVPPAVEAFEFEVHAPLGTVVGRRVESDSASTYGFGALPWLPDAGLYWFRARTLDDAGLPSAWSQFDTFRIDDVPPPATPFVTLDLDGGFGTVTVAAGTDDQGGFGYWHLVIGELNPADGGPSPNRPTPHTFTGTSRPFKVGGGTWVMQVHPHDAVGNVGPAQAATAVTVPEDGSLEPPGGVTVLQDDGTPWPYFPHIRSDQPLLVVAPPTSYDAGGYAFVGSEGDGGRWFHVDESRDTDEVVSFEWRGEVFVRAVALRDNLVSPYGPPTRMYIDTAAPNRPSPRARLDGGAVRVSWSPITDTYAWGSGLREYRVSRCCVAGASVQLGTVAPLLDAGMELYDAPGFGAWSWAVTAQDLAGNTSTGTARLTLVPDGGVIVLPGEALQAVCGQLLEHQLATTLAEPGLWSLADGGPEGLTLEPAGLLSWRPGRLAAGSHDVSVRVDYPSYSEVRALPVEVQCPRRNFGVACGCDGAGGASVLGFGLLALLARRRRRRR